MTKKYIFDYDKLDDYEREILKGMFYQWKYTWTPRFKLKHWRFYLKYYLRKLLSKTLSDKGGQ